MAISRRDFIKLTGLSAGVGLVGSGRLLPGLTGVRTPAVAAPLAFGLSDPAVQPKFVEYAPNALDPGFLFEPSGPLADRFNVYVRQSVQQTGLRKNGTGKLQNTAVWGYGYDDERGVSWPGRTFQVQSDMPTTVRWNNDLVGNSGKPLPHLLPVDTSLHWAYSLPGYEQYTIKKNGVPIVTHLHGGHTASQFDGNPEFFWSPDYEIVGPQWEPFDGIIKDFEYLNDQPAGNLWYHDHALGITRLNVYAGMAGFYFVRDNEDTGLSDNPLGLPAFPYELAYAIQDRMFTDKGALFYPAFPGDPFYDDFITGEGVELPPELFPRGGPTALAEFFGDHMVVNGKIWPKADVEPRNYRMRLLNGTDSRFLVVQFVAVDPGVTDPNDPSASAPLDFWVIGSDQGLGTPAQTNTLVFEPGGRYDVVVDFNALDGKRVIMKNIGGDAPFGGAFGGDLEPEDVFPDRQTDRIMAFDVVVPLSTVPDNFNPNNLPGYGGVGAEDTMRRVALFEGTDEFERLQPLLGTVGDDLSGTNVATAWTWFQPTTETPAFGSTEIWEIYNFTADAHPIHLHLVNFEILDREDFAYDITGTQTTLQHNGLTGEAPEISNIRDLAAAPVGTEYFEDAPKDMVTSLPGDPEGAPPTGQLVRIKAKFDKEGRYVWHCHILSHEDHEMMRVLQVVL
jgi:FtsP/CotA-like multicopper oxidase with cupredoxin domain